MAHEKEAVSRSCPCQICGRSDGDFRLHLENGYTLHWCFREMEEIVSFEGATFVRTGQKQTSIALYSIYMEESERRAVTMMKGGGLSTELPHHLPNRQRQHNRL